MTTSTIDIDISKINQSGLTSSDLIHPALINKNGKTYTSAISTDDTGILTNDLIIDIGQYIEINLQKNTNFTYRSNHISFTKTNGDITIKFKKPNNQPSYNNSLTKTFTIPNTNNLKFSYPNSSIITSTSSYDELKVSEGSITITYPAQSTNSYVSSEIIPPNTKKNNTTTHADEQSIKFLNLFFDFLFNGIILFVVWITILQLFLKWFDIDPNIMYPNGICFNKGNETYNALKIYGKDFDKSNGDVKCKLYTHTCNNLTDSLNKFNNKITDPTIYLPNIDNMSITNDKMITITQPQLMKYTLFKLMYANFIYFVFFALTQIHSFGFYLKKSFSSKEGYFGIILNFIVMILITFFTFNMTKMLNMKKGSINTKNNTMNIILNKLNNLFRLFLIVFIIPLYTLFHSIGAFSVVYTLIENMAYSGTTNYVWFFNFIALILLLILFGFSLYSIIKNKNYKQLFNIGNTNNDGVISILTFILSIPIIVLSLYFSSTTIYNLIIPFIKNFEKNISEVKPYFNTLVLSLILAFNLYIYTFDKIMFYISLAISVALGILIGFYTT
jgi:hypothetical protein